MSRVGRSLLFATVGLPTGALLGAALVMLLSGNVHDLSVEAAMTGIFVGGPLGSIAGFVVGFARFKR